MSTVSFEVSLFGLRFVSSLAEAFVAAHGYVLREVDVRMPYQTFLVTDAKQFEEKHMHDVPWP
jgi:hypothetical protein